MGDVPQSCRIGPFTLESERGALSGPDGEIRLRPKTCAVLLYLVRRRGRLVGRTELMEAVWGNAAVTDDSLTQCLVEIRRAFGDESRQIVRTVPRRGYVLDAPLVPVESPQGRAATADTPAVRAKEARAQETRRRSIPVLAVPAIALAGAGLAWWGLADRDAPAPAEPATAARTVPNSVAVLPFVDMSAAHDQAHLGEGIAEEILNSLAQSGELKIIARTSSFSFVDRPADIRAIAAQLGVAYVLEGSVRKSGNRVRVIAQLIDTRDGAHVWSEDFDRELGDIFAVQGEIATSVAAALSSSGGPIMTADAQRNVKAYEHFLRGRFLFHRRAEGDVEGARRHFEAAIERDPEYAAAWAALAGTYTVQIGQREMAAQAGFEPARHAVARALELDPESVEAHLRAAMLRILDGDEAGALQYIDLVESLDPENLLLLGLKGGYALRNGDRAAAMALQQRIVARDPLSTLHRMNLGVMLLSAGRLEEARAHAHALRELNPEGPPGVDLLFAQILILEERYEKAADILTRLTETDEGDAARAIAAHALGREADATAAVERLLARNTPAAANALAGVQAHRGDLEAAWRWLEVARQRIPRETSFWTRRWLQLTVVSPFLRPLNDDPRWTALFEEDSVQVDGRTTRK